MSEKFYEYTSEYQVIGTRAIQTAFYHPGKILIAKSTKCLGKFPTIELAVNTIINGTYDDQNYPVLAVIQNSKDITEDHACVQMPFEYLIEVYTKNQMGNYHREPNIHYGVLSFPADDD